ELENKKYITTNGIQAVKKVRKSEDRRLLDMPTFLPSHLLTFLLFTFLPSYFSKYLCLFVFIRGFSYPLSSFLFPISGLNVLVFGA
ncbi:MAG: hypothetical protein OEL58_08970, partial [Desulfobacteraceae bacterium]|nr:hypothetical protein [Desulfobacteraceae bacterium]